MLQAIQQFLSRFSWINRFLYPERSQPPNCGWCDRSYRIAGPFVEGISGALICGRCLRSIAPGQLQPGGLDESRLNVTPNDPYRAPAQDWYERSHCALCGQHVQLTPMLVNSQGQSICRECLNIAIQIIDQHEAD